MAVGFPGYSAVDERNAASASKAVFGVAAPPVDQSVRLAPKFHQALP